MRYLSVLACGVGFAFAGGCVSRELFIDSTPRGARAFVNGRHVGSTPVSVPFRHYGDYAIEVSLEGRAPARAVEAIRPPWYCRFPLGLFSELLLPVRIRDHRAVHYDLPEHSLPDKRELLESAARKAE